MAEMAATLEHHRRATSELEAATTALASALRQISSSDLDRIHEVERQVLTLAVALAEEIVGREIVDDEGLVLTAARRALELAPDRGTLVLRVHPNDVTTVRDAVARQPGAGEPSLGVHLASAVHVIADPAVDRAGAVVEVGPLRIDAQVGSAIARIRDAFDA